MYRSTFLLAALCLIILGNAQTTVTVSTNAGNSVQTYYSLQNGDQGTVALADWDLAFEITGFTASIRANTQKGMQVYKAPYTVAQWAALDTTGMANGWAMVHDSDTSWSHGALNDGLTANEFDLGWGVYNQVTHIVTGDSLFVVKLANGDWKKLRIDGLATSTYMFTWADLDGSNELSGSLNKAQYMGKNFAYYSLENNAPLDPEPLTADWDLLFTKYIAYVPTAYPVAGVLQNKNVSALQVDGIDPSLAQWTNDPFDAHINVIGSDWKTFNMQTFMYEYAQDRTYFVKDKAGNIWKLVFIAYGGSANGDMTFTQEMMSATGVDEITPSASVMAYPNPVTQGTATMVLDAPNEMVLLSIVDVAGHIVQQERFVAGGGLQERRVDVQGLSSGIYVLRMEGDRFSASTRLLID